MLVRLAAEWTDPFGIVHDAGDVVDIDVITLAELEERGVVKAMSEEPEEWAGPGEEPEQEPTPQWAGPGEQEADAEWAGPGETEDSEDTEE